MIFYVVAVVTTETGIKTELNSPANFSLLLQLAQELNKQPRDMKWFDLKEK